MNKSKHKISHRVLRTELYMATKYINEMNFGLVTKMLHGVIDRLDEYDIGKDAGKDAKNSQ